MMNSSIVFKGDIIIESNKQALVEANVSFIFLNLNSTKNVYMNV